MAVIAAHLSSGIILLLTVQCWITVPGDNSASNKLKRTRSDGRSSSEPVWPSGKALGW